uniref:Uncharacterized protein n=1 Tax=Oryza sativa subsp. japonica TaxID=39947 RepID=Q6YY44_ORYSJ|nr:hypothetical protein [Oryza sativa Japonica Group]
MGKHRGSQGGGGSHIQATTAGSNVVTTQGGAIEAFNGDGVTTLCDAGVRGVEAG